MKAKNGGHRNMKAKNAFEYLFHSHVIFCSELYFLSQIGNY
jgi:hypothetical protein